MSWIGAVVALSVGLMGLAATWNAARPLIDPARRYSAVWLRRTVLEPAVSGSVQAPTA